MEVHCVTFWHLFPESIPFLSSLYTYSNATGFLSLENTDSSTNAGYYISADPYFLALQKSFWHINFNCVWSKWYLEGNCLLSNSLSPNKHDLFEWVLCLVGDIYIYCIDTLNIWLSNWMQIYYISFFNTPQIFIIFLKMAALNFNF